MQWDGPYDGQYLAVGDDYGYVHIWETASWNQVLSQQRHESSVLAIAWPHGNSRFLASGGVDTKAWVWDLETQTGAPLELHTDWVRDVKWLPGDSLLVTAADDFQTVIWRWEKDHEATVKYPLVNRSNWHYAVAISDDGQLAVVAIGEGIVGFWDISGDEPEDLGTINIVETPIRDLDWRPGRTTIAGSVPNGVPITLSTYNLSYHYDAAKLDPTLVEEAKGENKIARNAYHYGPSQLDQFCWLNGRRRYAHLEPGGQYIALYDAIGVPAADSIAVSDPEIRFTKVVSLGGNRLAALTNSAAAFQYDVTKPDEPAGRQ